MLEKVDIIIPTWNNPNYLVPAINSILMSNWQYPVNIIVVNNGHPGIEANFNLRQVKVIQAPENLGWEGGLKYGLAFSTSKFVMFLNDDVFIPRSSHGWLRSMMSYFNDKSVGAVGPSSNCVMGAQNIWSGIWSDFYSVPYLIGFCMLLRREALEQSGGVDDTLPGGDDIDISIRLRKKGWLLIHDRNAFVYHHGFKTGERVHGGADTVGGWNSLQMSENTQKALIQKHGFRTWYETLFGGIKNSACEIYDLEGDLIRGLIKPGEKALELGCGNKKTVPDSFGIDIVPNGEIIATTGFVSVADVCGNVEHLDKVFNDEVPQYDVIIARHILEHCSDPIRTLAHWRSYLKPTGRLILALPNDNLCDTIPMNPEHKHAFTPENSESFMVAAGFWPGIMRDSMNGVSFVIETRPRNDGVISEFHAFCDKEAVS